MCRAAASQEGQGTDQEGHRKREPLSHLTEKHQGCHEETRKHRVRGLARAEGGGRGKRIHGLDGGEVGNKEAKRRRGSDSTGGTREPGGRAAGPPALGGQEATGREGPSREASDCKGLCAAPGEGRAFPPLWNSGASLSKDHTAEHTSASTVCT